MTVERLRGAAMRQNFFTPTTLKTAINRMGFVQADPIRSPARAQDLILRHRVKDYRVGDLERRYPALDVEEDFLYAYGFLPRHNWRLLHPRDRTGLSALETEVLNVVRRFGQMHPRELEKHLGRERRVNAWGGYSKATTHALQVLHYRGLLRVARRDAGIRIYEITEPAEEHVSSAERLKSIVLLLARIFGPVSRKSFREIFRFLPLAAPGVEVPPSVVDDLLKAGELESAETDGYHYVWPAGKLRARREDAVVRFLAPFDPLIWDRRRFEHFWGWRYRFEAYTPPSKRVLGYYAMPMLWQDEVIGWANVSLQKGQMKADLGFAKKRPRSPLFEQALEEECERLRVFLKADTVKTTKPIRRGSVSLL
ncbi:MAG: winged helix DNA-binding domain-containing protein [Acidobacteriota bacterium]|nr:winged helix DNA-binding domain-containing protein [Acidobacteriota bacterium]